MDRGTVMIIGADGDFTAQAGFHLSHQGWNTTCADLCRFQPDATAIPRKAVLVVAFGPHPDMAVAKIREIRWDMALASSPSQIGKTSSKPWTPGPTSF